MAMSDPSCLLLRNFRHLGQAENLKTTTVSQDWLVPANKVVQAAQLSNQLGSRPECQVVGIAENNLSARGRDLVKSQALDGAASPNGHEGRQVDTAARRGQTTQTCSAIPVDMQQFKLESGRIVHVVLEGC
jgi:hypothetical protein